MGTKLSFATRARGLSLRVLAITGMLLAASAITTSAASARSGVWRVSSGQTIEFTNMDIAAGDQDDAYVFLGKESFLVGVGEAGVVTPLSNFSFTNSGKKPVRVSAEVVDLSAGGCGFFSYGKNAVATPTQFSISDGQGSCTSGIVPTLGAGNFNGTVTITP